MRTDRNAVRAGLFILVALVLILLIVVGIQGFAQMLQPAQLRVAHFKLSDNVGGLQLGDPVRIGGYKVGMIRSIDIVGPDEDKKVAIAFAIPSKYPLKKGAVVRVQTEVTGSSSINIEHMGAGEVIPVDVPLVGRPSAFSEILASVSTVAPRIEQIIAEVQQKTMPAVDDAVARIGKTADAFTRTADVTTETIADAKARLPLFQKRYEQLMDTGTAALGAVRDFLGPGSGDFRATLANLSETSAAIKNKLPGMLDKINTTLGRIDTAAQSAAVALKDIETIAANTKDLSAAAKGVIAGNKGKLDGMIASLKATSDNLKGASVEIRRSPWRLLYKPTPQEMGNLNLYDSARQFAEGANDLNDSVQALRDALKSGTKSEADLKALLEKMHKSFDNFQQVEQKLWEGVKE